MLTILINQDASSLILFNLLSSYNYLIFASQLSYVFFALRLAIIIELHAMQFGQTCLKIAQDSTITTICFIENCIDVKCIHFFNHEPKPAKTQPRLRQGTVLKIHNFLCLLRKAKFLERQNSRKAESHKANRAELFGHVLLLLFL